VREKMCSVEKMMRNEVTLTLIGMKMANNKKF